MINNAWDCVNHFIHLIINPQLKVVVSNSSSNSWMKSGFYCAFNFTCSQLTNSIWRQRRVCNILLSVDCWLLYIPIFPLFWLPSFGDSLIKKAELRQNPASFGHHRRWFAYEVKSKSALQQTPQLDKHADPSANCALGHSKPNRGLILHGSQCVSFYTRLTSQKTRKVDFYFRPLMEYYVLLYRWKSSVSVVFFDKFTLPLRKSTLPLKVGIPSSALAEPARVPRGCWHALPQLLTIFF